MKNLWTVLPPLLADSFGFLEILKNSDGCGVIDDSGDMRPSGGGRGRGGGARAIVSGASAQDVTTGTRDALLQAVQEAQSRYSPSFILFSAGPCGAMIGTDLQELAETVTKDSQIPAAVADVTGQKPYDTGLSKTAEALVKLLARPAEKIPGTVNILGASGLDWAAEDIAALDQWAAEQGYKILARPGVQVTAAQAESMGKAQINLVVTVSGLAAARYLQEQFGTPYVAAAPFGREQCEKIARLMGSGGTPEQSEQAGTEAEALIIGEQFTANAVRDALIRKGIVKGADVATFFLLDKEYAQSGDRRIRGEVGTRELLNSGKYRLIAADPILHPLMQGECKWLDLPHRALNTYGEIEGVPLLGSSLDHWLEKNPL